MNSMRVGIQGIKGSFHHMAANHYFLEKPEVVSAGSFQDLIDMAQDDGQTDAAIMAIENSIAGSIMSNYLMLLESKLFVTGEIYLRITQNLMVLPGVKMEELEEVHSHPMAIQQCRKFLRKFPNVQLVETEDTAKSAMDLANSRTEKVGVIAGQNAAEMYNLEIIHPHIETVKNNYTRFLILERSDNDGLLNGCNKASIHFKVPHGPGCLVEALQVLADLNISMSKIQSFPVVEKEWQYYFHCDIEFETQRQFEIAIGRMKEVTEMLRILGIYEKGKTVI